MSPAASPASVWLRWAAVADWILLISLSAVVTWTTLCLGGYLAATLVITSWGLCGTALVGGLLWWCGRRSGPVKVNVAVLLPLPFLLYALASVLWLAPAPWLAWREWLLWWQTWLVFWLVLHFGRTPRQTRWLAGTLLGLGLAGGVMACYQRFGDPTWLMLGRTQAEQFFGRSSGMFGIPNSLAGLLELMIPALLVVLFSRSTRIVPKIFCAALAGFFLFALILTGSRGGWMGVGVALVIWPVVGGRGWGRRLGGAAGVLLLAATVVAALYRYSDHARERIQPFLEGKFESSRPFMWRVGWEIWRDHPLWGSGAGSYHVLFEHYRPRDFTGLPWWTHNEYLNTLSDYGIAGLLLWAGAGAAILWLGWRAVRRTRREAGGPAGGGAWRWRLGLWLGLVAFAIHLVVDFHTKIPALALAAAIAAAWLLRDEPELLRPGRDGWVKAAGLTAIVTAVALAVALASPLYRAEALRFDARRAIDRAPAGKLSETAANAKVDLERAVRIHPGNGQAWADLAEATMQSWHPGGPGLAVLGREGEADAVRALALCPIIAEFWVRKGVALDLQSRPAEGEECLRHAVALAPASPNGWYYLAYHLMYRPGGIDEARRALDTCLTLDPGNSAGVALRQQLAAGR